MNFIEVIIWIRKNDRTKTPVQKLSADLRPGQAERLTEQLNAAFASQGQPWFARTETIEE